MDSHSFKPQSPLGRIGLSDPRTLEASSCHIEVNGDTPPTVFQPSIIVLGDCYAGQGTLASLHCMTRTSKRGTNSASCAVNSSIHSGGKQADKVGKLVGFILPQNPTPICDNDLNSKTTQDVRGNELLPASRRS